tara:strand:- start:11400 stop:12488 length:1089 start_codon:yes stop_codon:yes gene_type:complete
VKIIFVCTKSITFNTFLKSQADFFIKKGLEIGVACSDSENLNLKSNLSYKINFPSKILDFINLFKYLKIFIQVKTLVKENPSAIFYLHTPLASHLFRLFTFFDRLKIVYFVHGFRFTSKTNPIKGSFLQVIEKILSIKTNLFITINNEDYYYCRSNLTKKSSCYKINGVGLDLPRNHFKKKLRNKHQIKRILVIAAYKKEKGYFEVLRAAQILNKQKIKIDCYGYGDIRKYDLIKNQKKIKNISLKNFDKKLQNKIKEYDILLHLSYREGLPVSVMQSLSMGLPVICYKIRGNEDLIKNRYNGYFVGSYKDVTKIISYLNKNPLVYNRIRKNAFKSINKNFLKKEINLNIFNIFKYYFKYKK